MNFTLGVVWFKHYKKGSCYVCESLLRWHAQWSIKVGEILHGTTHKLLYKLYQVIPILFHMWKFWYLHNFRKFWSTLQHQQLPIPSRRQSHYLDSQVDAAQQPSGLFLIQAWTTINFTLTFENLVKSDSTLFASPTLWCSTLCVW